METPVGSLVEWDNVRSVCIYNKERLSITGNLEEMRNETHMCGS